MMGLSVTGWRVASSGCLFMSRFAFKHFYIALKLIEICQYFNKK